MRWKFCTQFLRGVIIASLFWGCTKKQTDPIVGTGNNTNNPPTPAWDANAMRAVWITTTASTALDNNDNILRTVEDCKKAGINTLFVVVYNNARTIYPSDVMFNITGNRQLDRFVGRNPLKEIIAAGKAAGLKVHAWFEYGFAASFSAQGGSIIAAKPHWAALDQNRTLVVKNGFDWLNAFHPEVQQFMIDLFKEVVKNYEVDGVQGDDRLPALPSTAGYDDFTVAQYKTEHNGASPTTNTKDAAWIGWRAKRLNQFMKRLYQEMKATKPTIQVTISPSPYPWGLDEYLQDWPSWVDSGWVDAVLPQCYRYDINAYTATLQQQKNYLRSATIPMYPGVLIRSGTYQATTGFLTQMIQANRNSGVKGESFFFYEGLKSGLPWFQGQYPYIK